MKSIFLITCFMAIALCSGAQYYIRGEVRDLQERPIQNVSIYQYSTNLTFRSGAAGDFGIVSSLPYDSLLFYIDGYEPLALTIKTTQWQTIHLKSFEVVSSTQKLRLLSLTQNLPKDTRRTWFYGNESYEELIENNFIEAGEYPMTSLVLNVDKASYPNIRRMLNNKSKVPPDAVRIEELLNYFDFGYQAPEPRQTFSVEPGWGPSPWNKENYLLYLKINAAKINMDSIPPSNLVFLIDVSGSMDLPNKLPLLKSAFKLLVNNLRPIDTVSIVSYGGVAAIKLFPTSGSEKDKIIEAIDDLTAAGSTPGEAAIRMAYDLAKRSFITKGNNRVILATDGDFNVGASKEKELEDLITKMRQSGVYLTCLGVGMGNYKNSKLYALAKKGNGNIAYIDNIDEAEKVLVEEFFQTIYAVAEDVVMKVNFNDYRVASYRLIGFDNKKTKDEKFINATELEGGEIGSGHTVMAAFELAPQKPEQAKTARSLLLNDVVACIDIRYHQPGDSVMRSELFTVPVFVDTEPVYRFADCLIMFGSLLRESSFTRDITWKFLLDQTRKTIDPSNKHQNEFLQLVEKASVLYKDYKKKK